MQSDRLRRRSAHPSSGDNYFSRTLHLIKENVSYSKKLPIFATQKNLIEHQKSIL
jgi:hypothetical protein